MLGQKAEKRSPGSAFSVCEVTTPERSGHYPQPVELGIQSCDQSSPSNDGTSSDRTTSPPAQEWALLQTDAGDPLGSSAVDPCFIVVRAAVPPTCRTDS